jgi:hypothetical protein
MATSKIFVEKNGERVWEREIPVYPAGTEEERDAVHGQAVAEAKARSGWLKAEHQTIWGLRTESCDQDFPAREDGPDIVVTLPSSECRIGPAFRDDRHLPDPPAVASVSARPIFTGATLTGLQVASVGYADGTHSGYLGRIFDL